MLSPARLATCALLVALAPSLSAQVVIREHVELAPVSPHEALLRSSSVCPNGSPGPFSVDEDGILRTTVILTTVGDAANPSYVRLDATPDPGIVGATIRDATGGLRYDSVSMANYFVYQGGSASDGSPDTLRVYGPDPATDGWLNIGPVVAGESVEALWFEVAGVPFPGTYPLAPAGTHPFSPLCRLPEFAAFNTGDGIAQGNIGPVRIEAYTYGRVRAQPTPDTLFTGQAASLPALDLPPPMPLTLIAEDALGDGKPVGGFFLMDPPDTPDPAEVPRSGRFLPTTLQTTVSELYRVRFIAALDTAATDTVGTARIRVEVTGSGPLEDFLVPIYSSVPGRIEVSVSSPRVAVGHSVDVDVRVYNKADRFIPPTAVGHLPIGIGVSSLNQGRLIYGEQNGGFLPTVPYEAVANGEVTYAYTGGGCEGGVRIVAAAFGAVTDTQALRLRRRRGETGRSAACAEPAGPVTATEVREWLAEECPNQIQPSRTGWEGRADILFQKNVVAALGIPMERDTGNGELDGFVDHDGFLMAIIEVKNTTGYAWENSGLGQPDTHLNRLIAHREAYRQAEVPLGETAVQIGAPTYVVVTTSPRPDLDIGRQILGKARAEGINLSVYRLKSRLFVDWFLEGERQNVVYGGVEDWYLGIPLDAVPDWLDWTIPGLDDARELDDIDIQMMCQPQVTIRTAPTLP